MSLKRCLTEIDSPEMEKTRDLQILVKQQRQLADSNPFVAREGYIGFTGKQMVATPGELLFDPNLNDSDKTFWCVLRLLCQENGNASLIPDQGLIAERMGKSRASIITYSKMLRATRWITVIDVLRENNLPTRYSYAVHDTPLSIEAVMSVDKEFIGFLLQSMSDKSVPRLGQYCTALLQEIDLDTLASQNSELLKTIKQQHPRHPYLQGKNSGSDDPPLLISIHVEHQDNFNNEELAQKTDSENAPPCQKTDNKSNPAYQKTDSGETGGCQKTDSGRMVAQKTDNGESPLPQKTDSGDFPVVKNPDSGENTVDIYNTAHARTDAVPLHARAPTQSRIIPYGNNDNHPSFQDGGYGRKDDVARFAFFDTEPFQRMLDQLASLYSRHNAHAILNCLKRGSYSFKGEDFRHTVNADEAAIILVSLIDRDAASPVQSPLDYTARLIHRAYAGELCFVGNQYQRFLELSGQAPPASTASTPLQDYQTQLAGIGDVAEGDILQGASGTLYHIRGGILLPVESNLHSANKTDGIGVSVVGVEEVPALILAGKLYRFEGGEQ